MGNIFNQDFRDFITALNNQKVRYILVGGYSVILHRYLRTTADMDIWVERSLSNYESLKEAIKEFGMPTFDMNLDNFFSHPNWDVFSFGRPQVSINIMVKLKVLDFEIAFAKSIFFEDDGLKIRTINKEDLFQAKKSVGHSLRHESI